MLLQEEGEQPVKTGRDLLGSGMTVATGGIASICRRDKGLLAITPSGMNYTTLTPKDICVLDLTTGKVVKGKRIPSQSRPYFRGAGFGKSPA